MGNQDPSAYTEASPFAQLLLNSLNVELLDVFVRKHQSVLTAADLTEYTEAPEQTVADQLTALNECGLLINVSPESVEEDRYRLNKENDAASAFQKAQIALL